MKIATFDTHPKMALIISQTDEAASSRQHISIIRMHIIDIAQQLHSATPAAGNDTP